MPTDKQIAANRANSRLSTGPRTEAGKATSAQNAARHSLASKYLIVVPGKEDEFAQLHDGLRSSLIPEGPLEEFLFKRVLECAWNLERCRHAESSLYKGLPNPSLDPLATGAFPERSDRIRRYSRESENALYKATRELSRMQTERQFRQELPQPTARQPLSQACLLSRVMKNLKAVAKSDSKPSPGRQLRIEAKHLQFDSPIEAIPPDSELDLPDAA